MSVDIVHELINRLLEAAQREGTFTESVAFEVERAFRHDFNGEKFYVKRGKDDDSEKRSAGVVNDYLSGQPVEQIEKHHGISRATLYRYLKR